MSQERDAAVQAVVDRVTSYQDAATEGTVQDELRRGLGEAGVELDDADVTALAQAIERVAADQDGSVDVASMLGS